ncbi:HAD family hydrolase [Reinekea marina]|uniref:HAD family hydrolase n=1 Tax=Reinekea marina TaxID=1310421 RepID=A0ABV7WNC4_9GAMM|nr:HAD family hydrolase [Reinekea marina]MDN3650795.1 HAD family hydrolase [Reinekea marina]
MSSLLFDLDETLIDREETMRLFLTNQYPRFKESIKATKDEFVRSVLHHQKNGYENKHTAYQLACVELFGCEQIADELFNDFKDKYGFEAVLFDGAKETLDDLFQKYSLGIVTNGRARCQNAKIDFVGIRHFFKAIKISEEFGSKKPEPSIFEACLNELGSLANSCICIGDNPDNDLQPARELGMKVIWVRNTNFSTPKEVDGIIDSISDIQEAIQRIETLKNA